MPEYRGRFFEDFRVGDVYRHPLGRTVLAADNVWFTNLTMNTNPLHFDRHYSAATVNGQPLVNSCFTLALVTGLSVADVSQNAFANLGWEAVQLPAPLFEGETVYAQTRVLTARESATRPEVGIVKVNTIGFTETGKIVIRFERTIMVYKRSHAPRPQLPEPAGSTEP